MKLTEPVKVTIGDNVFYITPFPAMKAANISGEVIGFITPMLGAVLPFIYADATETNLKSLAPALTNGFDSLSGDKCEELLNKLIMRSGNVAVEYNNKAVRLNEDILNEIFCGEVQDLYILAFHVIKVNFGGFFKRLGGQSGNVAELVKKVTK